MKSTVLSVRNKIQQEANMFILTGTTGHLGSRVLRNILSNDLIPPRAIVISSSNPSKVPSIAKEHGVEVRPGDFTSPNSLVSSFRGGSVLFLVSFPSPSVERWEHHRAAIDAAKEAGVETIVYTSLMFGGESGLESQAGVQEAHIQTIKYLQESGLKYVIIREGIYAESWWLYSGFQPASGYDSSEKDNSGIDMVIPNDGPVAWVSWDELGEATATILAHYKDYIGQTLRLTGSETMTITNIAQLVEGATKRKVLVKVVGKDEAAKYHKEKKSVPEGRFWIINSWSGWHDEIANGETAVIDPLLEKLLGRRPRSMEEMANGLFLKQ